MNTTSVNTASSSTGGSGARPRTHSLCRPDQDRILAGVGSGIGHYLGVEPLIVRIALVVLVFLGGIGIPLYLACWLLMPAEGRNQSIVDEFVADVHEWRD
jgi:phage shock protein PspC (stress-responsive transcriptional regulator)